MLTQFVSSTVWKERTRIWSFVKLWQSFSPLFHQLCSFLSFFIAPESEQKFSCFLFCCAQNSIINYPLSLPWHQLFSVSPWPKIYFIFFVKYSSIAQLFLPMSLLFFFPFHFILFALAKYSWNHSQQTILPCLVSGWPMRLVTACSWTALDPTAAKGPRPFSSYS